MREDAVGGVRGRERWREIKVRRGRLKESMEREKWRGVETRERWREIKGELQQTDPREHVLMTQQSRGGPP